MAQYAIKRPSIAAIGLKLNWHSLLFQFFFSFLMKDNVRYMSSDCFEIFPFPLN